MGWVIELINIYKLGQRGSHDDSSCYIVTYNIWATKHYTKQEATYILS